LSKTKQKLTQILTFQRYVDNNVVSVTFYRFMNKIIFLFVKISHVSFPMSKTKQKIFLTFQRYLKDYVVYVTFVMKKFMNRIIFCSLK
jgi:hypothetical protein